jgi:antitoxin MazE
MKTRIRRWGNSLALRIPQTIAAEANLKEDSPVDLTLVDGRVVLLPIAETEVTLEQLLAGITEQNLHGEVDTGPAVGKEVW